MIMIGTAWTVLVVGSYWINSIRRLRNTTLPGVMAMLRPRLSGTLLAYIILRMMNFLPLCGDAGSWGGRCFTPAPPEGRWPAAFSVALPAGAADRGGGGASGWRGRDGRR